jgi:hypothetical protein
VFQDYFSSNFSVNITLPVENHVGMARPGPVERICQKMPQSCSRCGFGRDANQPVGDHDWLKADEQNAGRLRAAAFLTAPRHPGSRAIERRDI